MHFAPDTVDNLEFSVALVNTAAGATKSGADELETGTQLTALLTEYEYTGRFDRDDLELAEVRATRARLRRIWTLERDEVVAEVNVILSDARALPRLLRHDGLDWHLHASESSAPLAERIRVEFALALVDVIRAGEDARLRECEASDCTGAFIDLSRNGSKRFCGVRCGNRVNMVAYRERADAVAPPRAGRRRPELRRGR